MTVNTLSRDQLSLIAQGHAAFQLLWAGVELGLFDQLSQAEVLTREELAQRLGLAAQPARVLLVGLTALGLIEKQGDRFRNAAVAEALLVNGRPGNLVKALGWQRHIVYPGLQDFTAALQANRNVGLRHFPGTGNTLYERLTSQPALERIFQDAMSSLSSHANQHLVDVVDLSGVSHLLDVGGGDGTNAIALVRRFPGLRVTVFDSASVCTLATQNVCQHGLQDRIATCPGNLFETPYPQGIDAILYSHMFTIYSVDKNRLIVEKTYNALPTGGVALIFGMMGNDDDTGPVGPALGSPYFLAIATGEGMLYSWPDFKNWFANAGFSEVRRVTGLPLDHALVVAIK